MKKGLSLLLAASLAVSTFASAAFAADELTAQEKFDALVQAGIFTGMPGGDAALEEAMTRAQVAAIVFRLLGLEANEAGAAVYTDLVGAEWAAGYIGAITPQYMEGYGDGKFGPGDTFTYEQLATVLVRVLDLDVDADATVDGNVSDWAQASVAAAVAAGVLKAQEDYTVPALREALVETAYAANEALNPVEKAGIASIAQSGSKTITVTFGKALTEAEKSALTYEVKYGLVPYTVTPKYSEDNKSVVLENSFNFPAGDYTVTVSGFEAQSVKISAPVVTKVEIGATQLQNAKNQELKAKALNQFGEEVANVLTISAYGPGGSIAVSNNKVDLSELKVDDSVVVTAFHSATGLSANKTFKLVAESTVTSMTFGPAAPKKDKQWISVTDEDLTVAYTLVDQYGNNIKLPEGQATKINDTAATIGDVNFYTSDKDIVDVNSFEVDKDGVLKFDAGTKAGTAVITAVNSKSGASTYFNIEVKALAKLKSIQISHPGLLVAANEEVKIPYVALDSFDQPISGKDINKYADQFKLESLGVNHAYSFDSKTGELKVTFTEKGTTTLYAFVDNVMNTQGVQVVVEAEAKPVKVTGIKDLPTLLAENASVEVTNKKLNVVDSYGRSIDYTKKNYGIKLAVKDDSSDKVSVSNDTYKISAVAEGSKTIVITLVDAEGNDVKDSSYEYTTSVVKQSSVTSYDLATVAELYGNDFADSTAAGKYGKGLELTGKNANGQSVAIKVDSVVTAITSSSPSVVGVEKDGLKVFGKKKGTSTVAVWQGATKLAEVEITVIEDAPVVSTAKFKKDEYSVSTTLDVSAELEMKDQYGVAVTTVDGVWATSDKSIADVSATGVVTGVKEGEATISFVTSNGVVASTKIVVE